MIISYYLYIFLLQVRLVENSVNVHINTAFDKRYGVPVKGCFYLVVHSSVCIYDAFGQGYGHVTRSDMM